MRRVIVLTFLSALAASAIDSEEAMARHLLQELGKKWTIVETPEAIAAIAQSLSAEGWIEVKTVQSEQPLANTLPGGIVYVSTGLIQSATMGELAALLAHQIAHVTANHGRFASAGRSASIPLYFMGSAGRICMRGADATLLMPVAFKGRFVANEGDADLIARHYLERAGYDPIEVQPVFEKLLRPVPTPRKTPTLAR